MRNLKLQCYNDTKWRISLRISSRCEISYRSTEGSRVLCLMEEGKNRESYETVLLLAKQVLNRRVVLVACQCQY
jgi:hypothetical protein